MRKRTQLIPEKFTRSSIPSTHWPSLESLWNMTLMDKKAWPTSVFHFSSSVLRQTSLNSSKQMNLTSSSPSSGIPSPEVSCWLDASSISVTWQSWSFTWMPFTSTMTSKTPTCTVSCWWLVSSTQCSTTSDSFTSWVQKSTSRTSSTTPTRSMCGLLSSTWSLKTSQTASPCVTSFWWRSSSCSRSSRVSSIWESSRVSVTSSLWSIPLLLILEYSCCSSLFL